MNEDIEIKIKAERQRGFRAGMRFPELIDALEINIEMMFHKGRDMKFTETDLYVICHTEEGLKMLRKTKDSLLKSMKEWLGTRRETEKMMDGLIGAGYIFSFDRAEHAKMTFGRFDANHDYICYNYLAYDEQGNPIHENKPVGAGR